MRNFNIPGFLGNFMKSSGGIGAGAIVGAGVVSYCLYNSLYKVDGGYRSIKFNKITGVGDKVYSDGLNMLIPILERPIIFDIRTRPESINSLTGSKDLQMVDLTVRVLYKPDESKLPTIYRELGLNYGERVLPSIGNEVLKSVVAQYTAAELLTKRSDVSLDITRKLGERAGHFGILVDDVSITNLGFGKEYTHAVEQKQVAQQEAERSKFWVEKAKQEKKAVIIRAAGEAQAAELLGRAMSANKGYLDMKRIETSVEIADIIAHGHNKVILPSDSLLMGKDLQSVSSSSSVLAKQSNE
jgi:prohibitin 2